MHVFKKVREGDFTKAKFEGMSCDEEGLTNYGLKQVFDKKLTEEERAQMMESLGYDENLYSVKSRVFVFTCHSTDPMKLKIGDNIEANFHEVGRDMLAKQMIADKGVGKYSIEHSKAIIAQIRFNQTYGV